MENREVLLKYGKNPTFNAENREGAGFLNVTSGSAAQSSVIDDFATLPLYITYCSIYYLGFTRNGKLRSLFP